MKLSRDICKACSAGIVWVDLDGRLLAYDMDPTPYAPATSWAIVARRSGGQIIVQDASTARPVPRAAHHRHECIRPLDMGNMVRAGSVLVP